VLTKALMEPIIDLAPSAAHNPLARTLADDIRRNVGASPSKRRDFDLLRGSVAMAATDVGLRVTLRFDHGRVTVHDGVVGIPDVSIRGEQDALEALRTTPLSRRLGVPFARPSDLDARGQLRALAEHLGRGRLTIYGLWLHGRLLLRVVRVLSSSG
jgi:hypothetical protein